MSSDDQNLLSSLQQQVGGDRYLPPKVLEDTPNEVAEYEKEVLQGAGGLLAGGSVEKGFKMLVRTPKGVKVLKKLGMTDEDVSTVVDAIKSRDSGALTDFLARKGTGFVESTAKKLGIKGGKIANTTVKNLKEGKLPTRQELQDALTGGDKTTVKPSKSNLTNKPEDGADDDSSSSILDALRSKAKSSIKSVKSSLDDAIGDSSSKVSNLISKADDLKGKGFGKVSKVFDRARADIQGEDDFEGQSSAVKKLLQSSKRGRNQLLKNAKAKLKGEKVQQPKKPTSEFDDEDEQGDLFSQLSKLGGKPTIDSPIGDLNPFTNQPVDPLAKIKASKQKADEELKQVKDQIENEGDRDPYQDIYDQANRDSQKFSKKELGVGKKLEKDVDFKFKAPTREEHLQQLQEQETQANIPDDMLNVFKEQEVKPTIPASEQTGGIDPSTLPDDAGFQRGSSKIQAKKDIDPPEEPSINTEPEPIEPTVPEPPKPEIDDTEEFIQKTKIPDAPKPPVDEEAEPPLPEAPIPTPPPPKPTVPDNLNPVQKVEQLTQDDNLLRTTPAPPKPTPKPTVPDDPKPPVDDDPTPPVDGDDLADNIASRGEKVEDGIKSAFEDSLADDDNPIGVVASAVLGLGALIGGALRKAHHPKFIQPPPLHSYENFSVQEGVA